MIQFANGTFSYTKQLTNIKFVATNKLLLQCQARYEQQQQNTQMLNMTDRERAKFIGI